MFSLKRIQYLYLISMQAFCLVAQACTATGQPGNLAKLAPAEPTKKTESFAGIPGLDVVGPAVDGLRLRDMVARSLEKNCHRINIANNLDGLGVDLDDGLAPLNSAIAIRNLTELHLSGFPLTDAMLMPIGALHLEKLQVTAAKLSSLQAIKSMSSLKELDLSSNPLNRDALLVISSLPNISVLQISDAPVSLKDLKLLSRNQNLKVLSVNNCPQIGGREISMLMKALPSCAIMHRDSAEEKEYVRQSQRRRQQWIE